MESTFDIFKSLPDGPLWVTAVRGLQEAKEELARLAHTSPGEYFIHSRGEVIATNQSQVWAEVT